MNNGELGHRISSNKNKAEAVDTRNKQSIFTSAQEISGRSFKQVL